METIFPIILLVLMAAAFGVYNYWLNRSLPSDITMIKARLEEGEHRVVNIQRTGYMFGGRSTPNYRKYRVVVRSPIGGPDEVRDVGVGASLFGYGPFTDFNPYGRHRDFD
jgi:hypothetical protein